MRRRLILATGAVVLAGVALVACEGGNDGNELRASRRPASLPERTVKAGEVDIRIEPTRIDANGAIIKITLDTHSVELSMEPAGLARLEVGGIVWKVAGWMGDGPGGHHREGELQFTPSGPARGSARLTLSGFSEPVEAGWTLDG